MDAASSRRRLAWGLALLAPLVYSTRLVLPAAAGTLHLRAIDLLTPAMLLAFGAVGLLVATRQPGNAIGWILLGVAVSLGLASAARAFCETRLHDGPDPSRIVGLAAMYADASWVPFVLVPATMLLLLFPDGRLPSRRWRWVARAAVVGMAGGFLAEAAGPRSDGDFPTATGSYELTKSVLEPLAVVSFLLLFVGIIGAVAAIVARYREAGPLLRLQLRWLAAAGALVAVTFPVMLALYEVLPAGVADVGIMLSVLCLPAAAGVAILRYRLYDIDVVINRALVYGVLTVLLGGIYVGSVLLLELILAPSSSDLAVAASTLAVAALFRPVRERVQSNVDRRFFRGRYDAQRTLDAFAARLRDEVSVEAVQDALRAAAHETVAPAHASVWIRPR